MRKTPSIGRTMFFVTLFRKSSVTLKTWLYEQIEKQL
jgi:hypothetical protein